MDPPAITFHPSPSAPTLRLPAHACDAHVHVFGPAARFPFAAGRSFTPGDAPKEKLFALHRLLGIQRCVVVQSACHGYDNAATADAIAAKGGAYRGVALLPPSTDDATLHRLDGQGFCGVRFNYMKHLGNSAAPEQVIELSSRLAPLGWHLQIHMESSLIEEMSPLLKRSAVPVVIDHMGRVDASRGLDQPDFRHLRALLGDARFWVKVSCVERASRRPPPFEDAVPFARALVAEFGDRTLWGSDWPHPNLSAGPPDDGLLVDLIGRIAPGAAERQALMVDNPQRLYRFL